MLLTHLWKQSDFGLVINWKFHQKRKWVSALTGYMVDAIITAFDPIIITSQFDYQLHKRKLRYILSFYPGWSAPLIRFDPKIDCVKALCYSDPHYQPEERRAYFDRNGFDFLFCVYHSPFFYHFKNFPIEKFVHFPWALPDQFISDHAIEHRSNDVVIFGGKQSKAYDIRNWCRQQPGIRNFDYSGVENKQLTDEEYFLWLRTFDAIVAAGSSDPKYNLVTPKYFEIASAGALLIGQYCPDLDMLGFDNTNALIFTKDSFNDIISTYKKEPEKYISLREKGRLLIKERHKISDRIASIKRALYGN